MSNITLPHGWEDQKYFNKKGMCKQRVWARRRLDGTRHYCKRKATFHGYCTQHLNMILKAGNKIYDVDGENE